ncbi:3'-5' exonuclease [Caldimonas tepidiphila]|uniref:3'-5' exonuclease n=1 Tax=Caldimonas tepidiphila TaxID=2315841 RepID=UPI000E5AE122|nr:3'-5' exonuclease [Caldimonas tepidiphila]
MLQFLHSLLGREPAAGPALDDSRWIVADVESSGLDTRRDRLIAIAAVALHFPPPPEEGQSPRPRHPGIALGDSFEVILRQPEQTGLAMDKRNILLHGIGVGAQSRGMPPPEALGAWECFVGRSPLVGFHSAFDRAMIDRAMQGTLGRTLPNPWVDLEHLLAVLHRDHMRRSLDHWMQRYGIECAQRHQAAADTLATAQLLLKLWPRVLARCSGGFEEVSALARQQRYLPGRD